MQATRHSKIVSLDSATRIKIFLSNDFFHYLCKKKHKSWLEILLPNNFFQSFRQQQAAFLGSLHTRIFIELSTFPMRTKNNFFCVQKYFYDIRKRKISRAHCWSTSTVVVDKNNFDAFDRLPAKCSGILEERSKNMARRKFLISYRRQLPDPRNPLIFQIRKRKT